METIKFFAEVKDFRINRKKLYSLPEILLISLCAVVSGAEDFEEIAEYGRQKLSFLKTFMELPNGIPSHDTFNRVFQHLDKDAFSSSLYRWSKELLGFLADKQVCIDGKVLCGTDRSGSKKSGICIVTAWACEQRLVLGQQKVAAKSNEKTAIPELLDALEMAGSIVSIDAIACQPHIAEQIRNKKADYVLALKKNQGVLFEETVSRFSSLAAQLPSFEKVEYNGGRIEKRTCTVLNQLFFVDSAAKFKDCQSIIRIIAERTLKNQPEKTTQEVRYYLTSLDISPQNALTICRNHWGIENNLHWMLDVVFNEDHNRSRTKYAAENFATLRKIALQILTQNDDKNSIKKRRHIAAWNDMYLLKLIQPLF